MAGMHKVNYKESTQYEHADTGKSSNSSYGINSSSFRCHSRDDHVVLDEEDLVQKWASIERLPTYDRSRSILLDEIDGEGKRMIDVKMLAPQDRHLFIEKLIQQIEVDHLRLLKKLRRRVDKVGIKLPAIEVSYKNLSVEAKCKVVDGKPLPTLWNSVKEMMSVFSKLPGCPSREAKIRIVKDVSGIIKPGRMTLLLGPPGCGKTSLLSALSGNLNQSLQIKGNISYNGYKLEEFIPQKNSTYVSQYDLHIPVMTVRETIDFSARCQGVGNRAELMAEIVRREKQAGIVPDPDIDAYMKAISVEGLKSTLQTDYILKIFGLDICADTIVGDAMRKGISGGQKKRLTTGEMIVGPTKALFMDEITNGLDSSTAFQIVSCIQQLVHVTDATALVALLQPAPEIFELFDDIILMAEGKILYHGSRDRILEFFEGCGFWCPERKGVADFLQEVISRKDQPQYWFREEPYSYVSVDQFCEKFKASSVGKQLYDELPIPHVKSRDDEDSISFRVFSLAKWPLFRACMSRELLLMKRNSFIYIFKLAQVFTKLFLFRIFPCY